MIGEVNKSYLLAEDLIRYLEDSDDYELVILAYIRLANA
jgi:hypothetical protein